MRRLLAIRNYPVLLLVVAAVGFGCWVASAMRDQSVANPRLVGEAPEIRPIGPRILPEDPTIPREQSRPGVITADMVTRLQIGMARVDIEEIVGHPPATMVHPVANIDGRFTYRATYPANLDVTPVSGRVPVPKTNIGLEYDASRSGHPLVRVHIPDPMG